MNKPSNVTNLQDSVFLLMNALKALGTYPTGKGYCFCADRNPESSEHVGECLDARTAISDAENVLKQIN